MGRVYKAEQVPLGVEVVVKTLHRHMAAEPEVVKRFFREAQSASRLRHPNCIAILDFGEDEGTVYMAMEFLRGRTLADLRQELRQVAPARMVAMMSQVADVVEAAHRMNIIHRDLKPENIMVEDLATRRDFVKVLDFGIAKIVDPLGGGRLTQTGMIIGTPAYMAPEQARGEEIDTRTDIYAMGVICFELLTGRLPFEAATSAQYLAAHALSKPPPLRSLAPAVPPALAALIDRSLDKDPAARPQTALAFQQELIASLTAPAPAKGAGVAATVALPSTEVSDAIAGDAPPGGTEFGLGIGHPPCPRCGVPVPPTAKFCPECGATTTARRRSTKLGDKLSDLRRFLPSGLVDEIAQVSRVPAEKRDLAVLAIDVSGPALHEGGAGLAARVLDQLHGGFADIALRHGGTLERRAAGGLIVFGLVISHADDAERAVRAALEVRALAGDISGRSPLPVDVTMATHTGPAMVEADRDAAGYNPIGDTVELATRLAAASEPGRIVVTEPIRELVHGAVRLRRLASVRLKGRSSAVAVYEALEAAAATSAATQLAVPPMVGREAQLESVLRLLDNPAPGYVIQVTGEPGSGKSRFLVELAASLTAHRVLAISAPARPGPDRLSPTPARLVQAFGSSVDALRSHGLGPADARLLAPYLEGGQPDQRNLDAGERRTAVVALLRAALEHLAARCPVVLLIDDAHLADPLASALIRRLAGDPVPHLILVAAARPGYPLPWQDDRRSRSILVATMSALPDRAVAELVAGALQPTPPTPELCRAVSQRAGGSPLGALEVLRTMVDTAVLTSMGGRWTVTGDLDTVPRRDSLRALFAGRIDDLPDFARDVLACAAVIGDQAEVALLEAVVGAARDAPIARELTLLADRGLLVEADPGRVRFADASGREVAYDRLPAESRRRLHLAIATVLAERPGEADPETVGDHFLDGGDLTSALDWLGRAAAAARAAHDPVAAERILRRSCRAARAALDHADADASSANRRLAEDSLALGEVLLEQGQLAELREILTGGLVCAQKDDDPALIARLKRARGRAALATGGLDEATRDLEQAAQAGVGLRDHVFLAEVNADLGELHEKRGDLDVAARYLVRALELVQNAASREVKVSALRVLTALGRVAVRNRQIDQAERFLHQALTLAEELEDAVGAARVLGNLAGVHHARADYRTAEKFTSRALELARQASDQIGIARQLNNLGTLCSLRRDLTAATRHFEAAYRTAQRAGWREGMATAAAGRDRLRAGR